MGFHVDSETGRLRRVILHRPDLELKRLTPSNKDALLFDDVLWVRRARQEHDGFADVLRDRGVAVHLFGDLLREALDIPEARHLVLDRVFDEKEYGPLATDHLRSVFDGLSAHALAEALVGGMTKREFLDAHAEPVSVRFHAMELDDFLLGPLPNHLFTRDTSAWIYDGVSINAMRWPPGSARPSTSRRSTSTTRSSPPPARSTTGRRGRPTTRRRSRAATSWSSATAPC